jgi:hypothetical protein
MQNHPILYVSRLVETPKMSIRLIASLALAASFCLAPSNANAFGHRASGCCDPAPSCGCEVVVPSCGCEMSYCDPCDPCAKKHVGLFAKLKARKAAKACCAPTCCEPAPVCCEPAPVCCEPAPVCCEPAPSCGCEISCCDPCAKKHVGRFAKLKARKAAKACCEPSCGCEVAPSCGCELSCCGM